MKRASNSGFTLLEMVVVLGVIALVTHLAVRELGQWRRSQLAEVSNRTLEEIREAVVGSDFERDDQGVRIRRGFVADMGRLPVARPYIINTPYGSKKVLTLSELWHKPDDVDFYSIKPAVKGNLVEFNGKEPDEDDYKDYVKVGTGWRGPYIRVPLGRQRLVDGWGNPLEVPDESEYYFRLLGREYLNNKPVEEGEEIVGIRHLGSNGVEDDNTILQEYEERDYEVFFDKIDKESSIIRSCTLEVKLHFSNNNSTNVVDPAEYAPKIYLYWPTNGVIAGTSEVFKVNGGRADVILEGLSPGPCKTLIEWKEGSVTKETTPRSVMIHPVDRSPINEEILVGN